MHIKPENLPWLGAKLDEESFFRTILTIKSSTKLESSNFHWDFHNEEESEE